MLKSKWVSLIESFYVILAALLLLVERVIDLVCNAYEEMMMSYVDCM